MERKDRLTIRNVNEQEAYNEYADLWKTFESLRPMVRHRNRPVEGVIPRIQTQILQKRKKSGQLQGSKQAQVFDEIKELEEYQEYHVLLWEKMISVIEALKKNTYIQVDEREIYDMILK